MVSGKVTLGTSLDVDIVLQGTGVQPKHCIIENNANVVTLYPLAEMTTVDGLQVSSPIRLRQGNMLCIGRSNYLRFNDPAEANLMKKLLPNARISMAAPLNFFGNSEECYEKKPPMPPSRRSRDSWGEMSNGSNEESSSAASKATKYELFTHGQSKNPKSISPKVFPPGSATVNSPASVVLGHSRIPNGLLASCDTKSIINSVPASSATENGNVDYIEPPVPQTISSYPQKATVSSFSQPPNHQQNGFAFTESESDCNKIHSPKILSLPSPAFNRNPSPYVPDKFRSITPNMFVGRPSTPSQSGSITSFLGNATSVEDDSDRVLTLSQDGGLPLSSGLNLRQEDLESRKNKLESKMYQVSVGLSR